MSRKEAETLARAAGAVVSSAPRGDVNLIVIGEAVPPGKTRAELQSAFDGELQRAFESGRLETITETTFWEWLGLRPASDGAPPLYTPAALAELTGVATAAVRLWYRLGFLKSESRVGNLPYFALEEIPAVKRLKALFEAGSSPRQVSRAIERLRKAFPNDKRVLLHMSPTSDPRKILYTDGAHRQDSGGQSFFDFDRLEPNPEFDRPGESIPRLEDAFRTDGRTPGRSFRNSPAGTEKTRSGGKWSTSVSRHGSRKRPAIWTGRSPRAAPRSSWGDPTPTFRSSWPNCWPLRETKRPPASATTPFWRRTAAIWRR